MPGAPYEERPDSGICGGQDHNITFTGAAVGGKLFEKSLSLSACDQNHNFTFNDAPVGGELFKNPKWETAGGGTGGSDDQNHNITFNDAVVGGELENPRWEPLGGGKGIPIGS